MRKMILSVLLAFAAGTLVAPLGASAQSAAPSSCRDGERILTLAAPLNTQLPRISVGQPDRVTITEVSWPDAAGFAGLARAILVSPRVGNDIWGTAVSNATTLSVVAFCGTNDAVAKWAVSAHVPSLMEASRDKNGDEPDAREIGVYRLDYEAKNLVVVKAGPAGQAEALLGMIDVSFRNGDKHANVPITLAPMG